MRPLKIDDIIDQEVTSLKNQSQGRTKKECLLVLTNFQVQNLSGGELQRVALALCLGKPADVYLIDEPRYF